MARKIVLKKIKDSGITWKYNPQTKDLSTDELIEPIRVLRVTENKIKDVINFCNMMVENYNYYPYLVTVPQVNEMNFD